MCGFCGNIHATTEAPLMKEAYLISSALEGFGPAREQFAHLLRELQSEQAPNQEHG